MVSLAEPRRRQKWTLNPRGEKEPSRVFWWLQIKNKKNIFLFDLMSVKMSSSPLQFLLFVA